MANKDYKKEPKARGAETIRPERAARMAASSIERGDLGAFSNACKALAQHGSLASRAGSGKFWRDNSDPALLASRDLSSRRWLAMPVAWSQAPMSEKPWLLPRMLFCAAKAAKQSMRLAQDCEQESTVLDQLLSFSKKALADIDWGMSAAQLAQWSTRCVEHGAPAASWALIQAMHGHVGLDIQMALAAKALARCLKQGESLQVCKNLARTSGGVAEAERTLARLSRAARCELRLHDPDWALAQQVGGHQEEQERHGSLIHATLDSLDIDWSWSPAKLAGAIGCIQWLSSEGARMDRLAATDSKIESGSLLCPLGRACLASHPFHLVTALLDAGADPSGSEGCSHLPLSALCSREAPLSHRPSSKDFNPGESQMNSLEALISHGAPIDGRGALGESALHRAAGIGRLDFFERLALSGADLEMKDFDGKSWSDWTSQAGDSHASRSKKSNLGDFMARAEAIELKALIDFSKGGQASNPTRL